MSVLKEGPGSGIAVWAIDPFEGKIKPHIFEVCNLQTWINGTNSQIQPVYILNLPVSNYTLAEQTQLNMQKKTAVIAAVKNYLQEINYTNTLTPKILITDDDSSGNKIEKLNRYCDDVDAHMIIVSSRGRKGLDRFVFGSFAEALLLQSKRPIYFLTHQNGTATEMRDNKILFPTDFSEHSKNAFQKFLPMAKLFGSEIILFHAFSAPQQDERANLEGYNWVKWAHGLGVKTKIVIKNLDFTLGVTPEIIKIAKDESVRFIAMASNSGRTASPHFGSVANEVFRSNLFPVWICGPQALNS